MGKFVHEIDAMPSNEFEAWREFYQLYPFDDFHRYHRPAALLFGRESKDANTSVNNALKWLQPDPVIADVVDSDLVTLAAFGLKLPGQR